LAVALVLSVACSRALAGAPSRAAAGVAGHHIVPGSPRWNADEPPFRIAGIIVAPNARLVQIIILDATGRGGKALTLKEGSTLEGYRIKHIDQKQVLLEKDGKEIRASLGNPKPLQEPPAATPAGGSAAAGRETKTSNQAPAKQERGSGAGNAHPPTKTRGYARDPPATPANP
jgi:type II secretory pathway component PulC